MVQTRDAVLSNRFSDWLKAAILLAAMALLLWWYHHLRGRPYDLFSFNKSLAIAQVAGSEIREQRNGLASRLLSPPPVLWGRVRVGVCGLA